MSLCRNYCWIILLKQLVSDRSSSDLDTSWDFFSDIYIFFHTGELKCFGTFYSVEMSNQACIRSRVV